jgi:hypothetical protein
MLDALSGLILRVPGCRKRRAWLHLAAFRFGLLRFGLLRFGLLRFGLPRIGLLRIGLRPAERCSGGSARLR